MDNDNVVRNVKFTLDCLVKRGVRSEIDRDVEAVFSSIGNGLGYAPAREYALEAVLGLRQYMWERGAWRVWDDYVIDAIKAARGLTRNDDAAALTIYRAGLREALGDWEETLSLVNAALDLSTHPETTADALLYRGTALHNKGHFLKAYFAFARGLRVSTQDSTRMRLKLKLSRTLRALRFKKRAERLVDELLSWRSASKWFTAEVILEKVGYLRSDPKIALQYAERGLSLYQDLGFERGIAYSELAIGQARLRLDELSRASSHLERSAAIFLNTQYWPGMAHVEFTRGLMAFREGNYRSAAAVFKESTSYAMRTSYRSAALRGAFFSFWSEVRTGQLRQGFDRFLTVFAILTGR